MILEWPWPLMQEMASTQSSISEVLTDLNMTNNPSSRRTNTTAPEIAVAGQEPIAIGLLASALDLVRQKVMLGMRSASLRHGGLSFAFPFAVGTRPEAEPEIGDSAGW
jgi:hypothetical protein